MIFSREDSNRTQFAGEDQFRPTVTVEIGKQGVGYRLDVVPGADPRESGFWSLRKQRSRRIGASAAPSIGHRRRHRDPHPRPRRPLQADRGLRLLRAVCLAGCCRAGIHRSTDGTVGDPRTSVCECPQKRPGPAGSEPSDCGSEIVRDAGADTICGEKVPLPLPR